MGDCDKLSAIMIERVSQTEKELHTAQHRLSALEQHNLPTRVTHLETIVNEVRSDIVDTRETAQSTNETVNTLSLDVVSLKSTIRGVGMAVSGLVVAAQFLAPLIPAVISLLEKLAK